MGDSAAEVMIDLETMSTRDNACIISIGAVKLMTPSASTLGGIVDQFYVNVTLASCQDVGLHVESRTVQWWSQQSEAARKKLEEDPVHLTSALLQFNNWFGQDSHPIWANPATFDLTIMGNAYKAANLKEPWEFYDERCYRTLRSLFPNLPYVKPAVPHDAMQDATAQAEHLLKMLRIMKEKNVDSA